MLTFLGRSDPKQIGFARLVTDEVTFAYLTDVYVLKDYRGKGLGVWIMKCIQEVTEGWHHLRRLTLFTNEPQGQAFYKKLLDLNSYPKGEECHVFMWKKGPGSKHGNQADFKHPS